MRVAVIGLGYVGVVTAAGLAALGHEVKCIDSNAKRVTDVAAGHPPVAEPGLDALLRQGIEQGRLTVATELAAGIAEAEVIFIAVGTPSTADGIDLGAVLAVTESIGKLLRSSSQYRVICIKSTVVPTTTDGPVRRTLEAASGLEAGQFGLCCNPEFLREGTAVADFMNPDRIVIGAFDERSGNQLARLYEGFGCPVIHTTLRNAEMIKYASNALLGLLISYSNEIASLCESLADLDESVVMRGVHLDRRLRADHDGKVGFAGITHYLRAGIGFGGSCLPKDMLALSRFTRSVEAPFSLVEQALSVNAARPGMLLSRLAEMAGGLEGKVVAILGLAFKPNTDDLRDSPALTLAEGLHRAGAMVRGYDPMVHAGQPMLPDWLDVRASAASACEAADALVIATGWAEFRDYDWPRIVSGMKRPIVFDGCRILPPENRPANMLYTTVGTL